MPGQLTKSYSRERRQSGARVADCVLFWKTMQRYDVHFTFSKFFRKNFSKKCIFHRFTDSRICVSWKNLHNNIIIFILYIYYDQNGLSKFCVNVWICEFYTFKKFVYIRFFLYLCATFRAERKKLKNLWPRYNNSKQQRNLRRDGKEKATRKARAKSFGARFWPKCSVLSMWTHSYSTSSRYT